MDEHVRNRHRTMILSPYEWPYFYLPLKRYPGKGFPEIALLTTAVSQKSLDRGEAVKFIVKKNLSIFGPIGDIEVLIYDSVDAILDDGWEVD